jgi:hypothetical protein
LSGSTDAFVTKINATGTAPGYSTYLGGNNLEQGNGVAVDGQGAAYVTGVTGSSDFPTTTGAFQTTLSGGTDAFVTKIVSGSAAQPHPTSTSVACAPGSVTAGGSSTCSVTVTDTSASGAGTPTGSVAVMISGPAGGSLSHTSCTLAGGGASASCSVIYTPAQAGSETVAASYAANATFAASQGQTTVTVTKATTQGGGGGGGTGGGGRRVLAHMRLRSIRFAAAGHGCKVEHARRAPASSRTHRDCTHVLVTFAGTIDQHAGGQLISAALTHQVSGRRRPTRVHGRGRVVRGRWTVHVRLPGRNHEPGDRWRFALRYAGDKRLLPAEVDGGFRLEVELKGLPESERTPKPSGRR